MEIEKYLFQLNNQNQNLLSIYIRRKWLSEIIIAPNIQFTEEFKSMKTQCQIEWNSKYVE